MCKIFIFDFGFVLVLIVATFIANIFRVHMSSQPFSFQNHFRCFLELGKWAMGNVEMRLRLGLFMQKATLSLTKS